jgi:hypothetical protein
MAEALDIKIDTRGMKSFSKEIQRASIQTVKRLEVAVKRSAILLDFKAKEKIQKGSRSGRTYRRGDGTHQASAPGEPPKTDTAILVSSIRPVFQAPMTAEVGSLSNIAEYGGMLEEGTKNMAARPWLEPTLKENSDEISRMIAIAIKGGGLAE